MTKAAEQSIMSSDSAQLAKASDFDHSLFGAPGLAAGPPLITSKVISLSKSREYTSLASQVPNIFMIKDNPADQYWVL